MAFAERHRRPYDNGFRSSIRIFPGFALERSNPRARQGVHRESQRSPSDGYQRQSRPVRSVAVGLEKNQRQRQLHIETTQSGFREVSFSIKKIKKK